MRYGLVWIWVAFAGVLPAQWIADNPVTGVEREQGGVVARMAQGALRLDVCTDSIVRVRYSPDGQFPAKPDPVVVKSDWPRTEWQFASSEKDFTVTTARVEVKVAKADGLITWSDRSGHVLLADGPRKFMTPVTVNGEATHRAEDVFKIYGSEEALYGLGQHQAGVWNYRGESVDLSQENTRLRCRCWFRATATAFSGITPRAAASTTALRMTCI